MNMVQCNKKTFFLSDVSKYHVPNTLKCKTPTNCFRERCNAPVAWNQRLRSNFPNITNQMHLRFRREAAANLKLTWKPRGWLRGRLIEQVRRSWPALLRLYVCRGENHIVLMEIACWFRKINSHIPTSFISILFIRRVPGCHHDTLHILLSSALGITCRLFQEQRNSYVISIVVDIFGISELHFTFPK